MPGTPPSWANAIMTTLVRAPVVGSRIGRSLALITVRGARTGTAYRTPVQNVALDGHLLVTSQVTRRWWRNLRTVPAVTIERGHGPEPGLATVAEGDAARPLLTTVMQRNPRLARFYRVRLGADGDVEPVDLDELVRRIVVIDVEPSPPPAPAPDELDTAG
jgi:deazaflavin-dependent oxidoreductase (nitroreductase family)